jgi:hypothetical protein
MLHIDFTTDLSPCQCKYEEKTNIPNQPKANLAAQTKKPPEPVTPVVVIFLWRAWQDLNLPPPAPFIFTAEASGLPVRRYWRRAYPLPLIFLIKLVEDFETSNNSSKNRS